MLSNYNDIDNFIAELNWTNDKQFTSVYRLQNPKDNGKLAETHFDIVFKGTYYGMIKIDYSTKAIYYMNRNCERRLIGYYNCFHKPKRTTRLGKTISIENCKTKATIRKNLHKLFDKFVVNRHIKVIYGQKDLECYGVSK